MKAGFRLPPEGTKERKALDVYKPAEPPEYFAVLFYRFLDIWGVNDGKIRPVSVLNYQKFFQVWFSPYERRMLFKMKGWANQVINDLDDDKTPLRSIEKYFEKEVRVSLSYAVYMQMEPFFPEGLKMGYLLLRQNEIVRTGLLVLQQPFGDGNHAA